MLLDYYRVLGQESTATIEELKAAHVALGISLQQANLS